jgi:hypothetical protein
MVVVVVAAVVLAVVAVAVSVVAAAVAVIANILQQDKEFFYFIYFLVRAAAE